MGGYFSDSLFSDIDSLLLYAGIHRRVFGFHRLLSKRFPYTIYYRLKRKTSWWLIVCWIAGKIRIKSTLH